MHLQAGQASQVRPAVTVPEARSLATLNSAPRREEPVTRRKVRASPGVLLPEEGQELDLGFHAGEDRGVSGPIPKRQWSFHQEGDSHRGSPPLAGDGSGDGSGEAWARLGCLSGPHVPPLPECGAAQLLWAFPVNSLGSQNPLSCAHGGGEREAWLPTQLPQARRGKHRAQGQTPCPGLWQICLPRLFTSSPSSTLPPLPSLMLPQL